MSDSAAVISVVTLGVSDVDAAIRFYRDGLGFSVGAVKGSVTYFDTGGTWLAVFPRDALARYANVSADGAGFSGVTLSRNVDTRESVDALMAKAKSAGAEIVNPAAEIGWGGYTGWFRDPDGHLWEVVWNPRPFVGKIDK
jgi:catechol 2,3-dioxygenase-like lactoylglutathione lyase family enzyme